MSPARAQVGVLHCDSPPPPIQLAHHAGTDAGALALLNVAVYVEPRMYYRRVRREKAHMHLRRLAGARSKRPFGAVQAPHQVPEVGTCFGPCAVDGNELGIVDQRLDHAVRVVSAPCLVEPQFNLANRIFICLSHDDISRPCRAPCVTRLSSPPPCRGSAGPCGRSGSLQGADTLVLAPCHSITRRRRAPASAAWWGASAFAVLRLRGGLNWSAARPADRRACP